MAEEVTFHLIPQGWAVVSSVDGRGGASQAEGAVFAKGRGSERVFSIREFEKGPRGLYVSSRGRGGTGRPSVGSGQPSKVLSMGVGRG